MELKSGLQCHWHLNKVSEWSRQDVTPSYSMWSGFSARSDRWSGFAACVFWPQAVNGEVPWLTVWCDNRHRLSVTAQIDWFPNLPRTLVSLIFLQTLYLPHLYWYIYRIIGSKTKSHWLKLFCSYIFILIFASLHTICSSILIWVFPLTLYVFMPPQDIAPISIMQCNSSIHRIFYENSGLWQIKVKIFIYLSNCLKNKVIYLFVCFLFKRLCYLHVAPKA